MLGVVLVAHSSLSVGIMFISYAAHTRFHPFLDPMTPDAVQKRGGRGAIASGMQLIYVRTAATHTAGAMRCARTYGECGIVGRSLVCMVAVPLQTFKYNTLETLYLSTAMFILLSGACACV
jgi:hypothetical protein